jgi:uncharacterized protein (DUF697 family)
MSKKLPGLNRRAPNIDVDNDTQADSTYSARAKPKPSTKPDKKKQPDHTIKESAFVGERAIDPENLSPKNNKAIINERLAKAMIIVNQQGNLAMAGGLMPIPLIDVAVIIGMQISMLKKLSALYNVPFHRNRAKAIVMSLVGGFLSYMTGAGLAGLLARTIPVLGWGVGIATISVLAKATTQATGVVFIQHYESGGTLLNFDPVASQDFYKKEFDKGRH